MSKSVGLQDTDDILDHLKQVFQVTQVVMMNDRLHVHYRTKVLHYGMCNPFLLNNESRKYNLTLPKDIGAKIGFR